MKCIEFIMIISYILSVSFCFYYKQKLKKITEIKDKEFMKLTENLKPMKNTNKLNIFEENPESAKDLNLIIYFFIPILNLFILYILLYYMNKLGNLK